MTYEQYRSLVQRTAHHIWEVSGKPEGQSEKHWLMAEWLIDNGMQVTRNGNVLSYHGVMGDINCPVLKTKLGLQDE